MPPEPSTSPPPPRIPPLTEPISRQVKCLRCDAWVWEKDLHHCPAVHKAGPVTAPALRCGWCLETADLLPVATSVHACVRCREVHSLTPLPPPRKATPQGPARRPGALLGALCEAAERDPVIADLYHRECPGNAEVYLPGRSALPVAVYRCDCPCHGDEGGRAGDRH